jgi:hypothetical protein
MGMNGINDHKYISLSSVNRKLYKNNANDDNKGKDDFDALNSKPKKSKTIDFNNIGHLLENQPISKPLTRTIPIINKPNTNVLSDPKVDSWKRAMLFMDQKQ